MKSHPLLLALGGGALALASAGCSGGAEQSPEQLGATSAELTTTYQAENASDIDEGVVESIHAGFTGTGYLNINNFNNTFALYIVNRPVAGTVAVKVRYANGGTTNRPINVSAGGGGSAQIAGAPTGSWTNWVSATVNIAMAAGDNDFVLSSVSNDGMPNIDKFDLTQAFTRTFQAENAFDIDEGVVEAIHPGFTGTGYLNINNFNNTFAWYIVNSPAAATVAVTVRYANGGTTSRPIDVQGAGPSVRIAGAPTGSWSNWTTATVNVPLDAGDNDFFLFSVSNDGMPNVDKFDITW